MDGFCANANVTYVHRVDDPENYNWCIVPDSAYDAVLFAGVALLVACVVSGRLSAVWVLVAGALCEVASFRANLGRFGNSVTLWLGGIHPGEVFFYTFLPPLLLDSASRVDFFIFKKVLVLSLVFAFVLVCTTTLLAVPLMLWGLGLGPRYGWGWADVALFNAMVASTDAVAVTSVLRAGGAPELLGALLEGESLFNDASGIVLFDIFLRKVLQARHKAAEAHATSAYSLSVASHHHQTSPSMASEPPPVAPPPVPTGPHWWPPTDWLPRLLPPWAVALVPELTAVSQEFAWLVVGGLAVGLICGVAMKWALRLLQWRRLKPHVEVSLTFAAGYLVFYVANAYLSASGVIAVVVFGVYGAANGTWGLSSQALRARAFDRFWDVLAFCINGLIFFLLGASGVNYLIRLGVELDLQGGVSRGLLLETLLMLPILYVTLFAMRGALIAAFCFASRALNRRRLRKHMSRSVSPISPASISVGTEPDDPHFHSHHKAATAAAAGKSGGTSPPHHSSPEAAAAAAALAATPDWRGMIFATVGGLRGAVSLIMAQIVLAAISSQSSERHSLNPTEVGMTGRDGPGGGGVARGSAQRDKEVTAQMVVWTTGFVLMSLVVNAPLLTPLMTLLRLNTTSTIKQQVRARAKAALRRFTTNALSEMKAAAALADGTDGSGGLDMGLMLLRGVDWAAVERVVDLTRKLDAVFPGASAATVTDTHQARTHRQPTSTLLPGGGYNRKAVPVHTSASKRSPNAALTTSTRCRATHSSGASASLLEPLMPREILNSQTSGGAHRQTNDHRLGKDVRHHSGRRISRKGCEDEQFGQAKMECVVFETGGAASAVPPYQSHTLVRFQETGVVPLGEGVTAAAAVQAGDAGTPTAATMDATASGVPWLGASRCGHLPTTVVAPPASSAQRSAFCSVFSVPGAADAAAADAITTAAEGNDGGKALIAAAATTSTMSNRTATHQGHLESLLLVVKPGSIAAAAAATTAARSLSSNAEAGAMANGIDAAALPAEVVPDNGAALQFGSGEAGRPLSVGYVSPSVNPVAGLGDGGGSASGGGGGASVPRPLAASRDRTRSRTLDQQFAALQGSDESGLLECPFASYSAAAPEAARRAPRESSSTAPTTTPRSSHMGYMANSSGMAIAGGGMAGRGTPRSTPQPSWSEQQRQSPLLRWEGLHRGVSPTCIGVSPPDVAPAAPVPTMCRVSYSPPVEACVRCSADVVLVSPHANSPSGEETFSSVEVEPIANAAARVSYVRGGACDIGDGADDEDATAPAVDVVEEEVDVAEEAPEDMLNGVSFAFAGHLGPVDSPTSASFLLQSLEPFPEENEDGEERREPCVASEQDGIVFIEPSEQEHPHWDSDGSRASAGGGMGSVDAGVGISVSCTRLGNIEEVGCDGGQEQCDISVQEPYDEDDVGEPLMSTSAPARFHVLSWAGAAAHRKTSVGALMAVRAPVRPEQRSGAQLETLEEEVDDYQHQQDVRREPQQQQVLRQLPHDESAQEVAGDLAAGDSGRDTDPASTAQLPLYREGPTHQAVATTTAATTATEIYEHGDGSGDERHFPQLRPTLTASQTIVVSTGSAPTASSPFIGSGAFPPCQESGSGGDAAASGSESFFVPSLTPAARGPAHVSTMLGREGMPNGDTTFEEDVHRRGRGGGAGGAGGGSSRRLSDPGSGPLLAASRRSTPRNRMTTADVGADAKADTGAATAAAARRQRMLQTRLSPSFAIGVGTEDGVPQPAPGVSGLTRHLGFSKLAGEPPLTSASQDSSATIHTHPWRITRQPSSRWVSVAAADAMHTQEQQPLRRARKPSVDGPGVWPVATAAGSLSAAKIMGPGGSSVQNQPLSRRWASLQDLAGHERALDVLRCAKDTHKSCTEASSGSSSGMSSAGSASALSGGSHVVVSGHKPAVEELKTEFRIRLLSGFKRFFHEETLEGVLSPNGMRLLCHCCDEALHQPSMPLELWTAVEREVVGRWLVQWQAWAHLGLRRSMQRLLRWESPMYLHLPARGLLLWPMRMMADVLSSSLSRVMLVAMEVAVELATALSDSSPQLQWLRYTGTAGQEIWSEVSRQGEAVRRFILDRVIEAPDKFQATQSHRASMALLRQQVAFVRSMLKTGLVDGEEAEALSEPIERRIWRLEARGPRWQQPTLSQVLSSCALLRGLVPNSPPHNQMLDWLRAEGDLWAFPRGADLTPLLTHGGVFVVVQGTIRVSLMPSHPQAPAHDTDHGSSQGATTAPAVSRPSYHARGSPSPSPSPYGIAPSHGHRPPTPADGPGPTASHSNEPGQSPQFYVGVGGVVGISSALVGRSVPGMAVAAAVAEGNTLGKGPVVFAMPPAAVATIRSRASVSRSPFQVLLLNMYRLVGSHVLERQRAPLVTHIAALLVGAVAHAANSGGWSRAERLRRLLVGAPELTELDRAKNPTAGATTSLRRKQKAVLDEVYDVPVPGLLHIHDPLDAVAAAPATAVVKAASECRRRSRLGTATCASGAGGDDDAGSHSGDEDEAEEDDTDGDEGKEVEEASSEDEGSSGSGSEEGRRAADDGGGGGRAASQVAAALADDQVLSRRCLERASEIVEGIRQSIKGSSLELLQPSQTLMQRSTLVLLNGTLLQHNNITAASSITCKTTSNSHTNHTNHTTAGSGSSQIHDSRSQQPQPQSRTADGGALPATGAGPPAGGTEGGGEGAGGGAASAQTRSLKRQPSMGTGLGKISNGEAGGDAVEAVAHFAITAASMTPMPVFKPPTILLWLPEHCEPAVARVFRQSELIRYTAGPTGAVVLVCGDDGDGSVVCR